MFFYIDLSHFLMSSFFSFLVKWTSNWTIFWNILEMFHVYNGETDEAQAAGFLIFTDHFQDPKEGISNVFMWP